MIQTLIDLASPTNTLEILRRFHDLIESHIRSLTSLGRTTDTYSTMLVPFLLRKLPVETIRNLTRDHENSDWTIEELQAALLKEIRIFETSLHIVSSRRSKGSEGTSSLPTAAFHANVKSASTNPSQRPGCSCKSNTHNSSNCDTVKTQQARVNFIKQNKLCFNCQGHHRVARCTSKARYRLCRRKHHTSLCTNNTDDSTSKASSRPTTCDNFQSSVASNPPTKNSNPSQDTPAVASLTISTTTTLQSIHMTNEPICLLKTVVASVSHECTQVDANILSCEGSQHSFATQFLIDKLQLQPHQTESVQLSTFGSTNSHVKKLKVANLQVITTSGTPITVSILIVPSIATPLENTVETSLLTNLPHLKGLQFAYPVTRSDN